MRSAFGLRLIEGPCVVCGCRRGRVLHDVLRSVAEWGGTPIAQLLIGSNGLAFLLHHLGHGPREYRLVAERQRPQGHGLARCREHLREHHKSADVIEGKRGRTLQRVILADARSGGSRTERCSDAKRESPHVRCRIAVHIRIGIREPHRRRIGTGSRIDPLGEPCREGWITSLARRRALRTRLDAHALRVGTTAQRSVFFDRGARLKREKPANHPRNFGLLGGGIELHRDRPVSVAHFGPGSALSQWCSAASRKGDARDALGDRLVKQHLQSSSALAQTVRPASPPPTWA